MKPVVSFGERLRAAREESTLTLEEIAARIGVSVQGYLKWERGDSNPEAGRLPIISKVLCKKIGWLFGESTEPLEQRPPGAESVLERIDQLERREEEARERHEEMMAVLLRIAERLGDATKAGGRPQLLDSPARPGRVGEGGGA